MDNKVKKLKTAVVGLGRIGWQFHVPEIASHEGFEFIAVADLMVDRIQEAEKKYNVKGYTNYEEMLRLERPDLVVIASPTKFHCEQTCLAFEHGADVFCEKPVALSVSEMDKIIESMNANGRKFMAYQPHRGYNDIVCLKHILDQNLIGDIYMIKRSISNFIRRNDWQAFLANGGGMLNNYGSHFIDQLMYIAQSRAEYMKCFTRKIACLGDADDVVKFLLLTENGLIMDLDINSASAFDMRPWHVFGKYGSAILDYDSKIWKVKYYLPEELESLSIQSALAAEGRSYSNGERLPWRFKEYHLSDFDPLDYYSKCYDYFGLDKKPFVDITESRQLVSMVETCRDNSTFEMQRELINL